ncbi:MAG TPA: FecR domain-containing protein [Puia sp.]|nr:FecR domain-containing protein [Puia sp.]
MNREEQIRQLLEKYEQHTCSPEEIRVLRAWLEEQAAAGTSWEFTGEKEKAALKNKIKDAVFSAMAASDPIRQDQQVQGPNQPVSAAYHRLPAPKKSIPWIKYASMAAVLAACVWGITWLLAPPRELRIASAPGAIEKRVLPDGSTLWLNNNSEVVYKSDFARRRHIELKKGEVFLDVKKDPAHPFTLQAHELTTTVLGTSFSAKIVGSSGAIKVSVATGKVSVSRQKDTLGFLLPNQRLRFDRQSGRSGIDSVLSGEAGGWVTGDLFLQNASLEEVIQWLQDHFNVNVSNKRQQYAGKYYLQAKSDIPLPEVLKILNLLGTKDHVRFELQHQTIIIQ